MVYMMLGTGFEVTEAMVPLVMMRRAGIDVCTVGINGKTVYGSREICPDAYDKLLMKYTAVCKERDELKAKLTAVRDLIAKYERGELNA